MYPIFPGQTSVVYQVPTAARILIVTFCLTEHRISDRSFGASRMFEGGSKTMATPNFEIASAGGLFFVSVVGGLFDSSVASGYCLPSCSVDAASLLGDESLLPTSDAGPSGTATVSTTLDFLTRIVPAGGV